MEKISTIGIELAKSIFHKTRRTVAAVRLLTTNDAEVICEAVSRPSMRFVPIKSENKQALLMTQKAREFLVRQNIQIVNASC